MTKGRPLELAAFFNLHCLAIPDPQTAHDKDKNGRRLLPLRPVSGAYCHHGSLTPVFTLLPVTPPAFRTWRPADFADALRRWPPAQRKTLREKMDGVALILLPDSFPDKKYVM
nr:hypothetical protein [Escherichia coli]